MVERLDAAKPFVQALVITPTRELAQQIAVELKKLLGGNEVKVLAVTGGRDFEAQKHKLDGKAMFDRYAGASFRSYPQRQY